MKALGAHGASVYAVVFSPDGKSLASASADNTVKIWDVMAQKELKVLKGHEQPVTAVTFTDDSDSVVTASMDRSIRVWSVTAVKELKKEVKEPKDKTDVEDPKDKKDTKDPKDKKKDVKDPKDKKDDKAKEPEKKTDPKDLGEMKRLGPTTDDPYAIVWSPKTKTLVVCGYSGQGDDLGARAIPSRSSPKRLSRRGIASRSRTMEKWFLLATTTARSR